MGEEPRRLLLDCYGAALAAVDARVRVREHLLAALQIGRLAGDWHLVAIGKAAGAMASGAISVPALHIVDGIVVSKPQHFPSDVLAEQRLVKMESAHPTPDERSLAAGAAVADFVAGLAPDAQVLYLISGGASSLVEQLVTGATLADLQQLNERAHAGGIAIAEFNALRGRISRLKAGGLGRLHGRRPALALFVSDVPGDDPRVIGSGLLHPPRGRSGIETHVIAGVRDACLAAAESARVRGYAVRVARTRLTGDAASAARRVGRRLRSAAPMELQVWGGETTMHLPAHPGRGGRCQHLALCAARNMAGQSGVYLLAAGTDGIDGASADAGALVDGESVLRGLHGGQDPERCINLADSGQFLEASGDLLHTGPTLTNVGDLVLGLRWPSRS